MTEDRIVLVNIDDLARTVEVEARRVYENGPYGHSRYLSKLIREWPTETTDPRLATPDADS